MPTATITEPLIFHTATVEPRVVFLGTPAIAVPTLKALAATLLRPILVITEPDKPAGRGQTLTAPAVKVAADELGIPVLQPADAEALLAAMRDAKPTLGVVIAYGRILSPELLAVPGFGFVNLHFSLLPKYRGATPIQAAIFSGEAETGVTLMQLDPGLDTGPILGLAPVSINADDTAGNLAIRLAEVAAALSEALLPRFLTGEISPKPQSTESPTPMTRRLTKDSGKVDWSASPESIERLIRAMNPWPRAWTELADTRFIIHAAHLEKNKLVVDQIQAAGKQIISGKEFARGYPTALTALVATGKVAPQY